jgi:signal transduction histidine kinase
MYKSQRLSHRFSRHLIIVGLLSLFTAIVLVFLFVEEIEISILELELLEEKNYIADKITQGQLNHWQSARLDIYYLPDTMSDSVLPDYMQGRSAPFRQELIIDGITYLLRIDDMDGLAGQVYLSQDISILESRLDIIQVTLGGIALAVCVFVLLLARKQSIKLTQPLNRLLRDIQFCERESSQATLTGKYEFQEFDLIAASFNRYVERQRESINREKSFIKLASHELRTPLSVIAGATDVILKRGKVSTHDSLTVDRIRQATTTMQQDVNALLQLSRQPIDEEPSERRNVVDLLAEVSLELERSHADFQNRIEINVTANKPNLPQSQHTQPEVPEAMGRLVFRNLIRNALQHTEDRVIVDISNEDSIYIRDFGHGLPQEMVMSITDHTHTTPSLQQHPTVETTLKENSFGLLIVQLVCERLNWTLELVQSSREGTIIKVNISADQHP